MEKLNKFKINSYILYKFNNEWQEGRINKITNNNNKDIYHILSFATLNELILKSDESIIISNSENKRKLKVMFMNNLVGQIHIPYLLKSLMMIDKEWIHYNTSPFPTKFTVIKVLNNAKIFFIENALSDPDEIIEVINGFTWAFNYFFNKFLLFKTEQTWEEYNKIDNPVENCGSIYLLRFLYFLQSNGQEYIKDLVVYSIIYEYTIYLLDFLTLNSKEIF